jgi:hypothetical protein
MALETTSTMQDLKARWATAKPIVIGLGFGLLIGPFLSNYMGWQVTARTAREQAHAGVVEQQAAYCNIQARGDVKEPDKLDWSARSALAKKWAALPGTSAVASDVISACSDKLARS